MWGAVRSTAPDALLENQWHLKDRTAEIAGANVRNAWPTSQGAGIVIGIVDDGLQYTHPDLSPNYLASASWDFNFNDGDPYPTGARGTAVAGVAAARGDNTIGVAGVAPQASLAGLRLTAVTPTDTQEAAAFGYLPQVIDILNNAWNPSDNGATLKGPGPLAKAARQNAVATGRNGKGRIFVWPAGDGRLNSDDCNFDGYANSRFAISVAAGDDTGYASPQTERCAALTVLAPAGLGSRALTTTDLIGTAGYEGSDYTSQFGTSLTGGGPSATATVSGAAALMLSRNPNLGWRDVKDILRRTSYRINPTDPEWTPGVFPHSHRLGFGQIDVQAAVDMAGSWTNLSAEEALTPPTRTLNLAIPDTTPTGITDSITISSSESNFVVEHVEIDFNAIHPWRGDMTVSLTSPAGIVSNLATVRPNDFNDNFTNWTFGSVRHWGEPAAGVWTLRVADVKFRDVGTWTNWTLRIYGRHVGLAWPGAFSKTSPANGATGQSTSPTLSWGQSSDATSYEYCIDTTNNGMCNAPWVSTGMNTSVGLSGLSTNTAYYWHVRAVNGTGITYADGNSATFWSFSTPTNPPGAFVHSSPANGATGQSSSLTLSWTASSGATNYEYCYDTSNNSACNATWISTGLGTSVALNNLASGTTFYWHVRANNGGGTTYAEGASTSFWNFTTTVSRPGAFSHSSPANGASGQPTNLTLSWTASSGATSYEYCYDTSNNSACNATWISAGGATSVGLSGLANGTEYYWHVRAINSGGTTYAEANAAAFWMFKTVSLPGAFSHLAPANGATGQQQSLTLLWGSSAGATSYEYCVDTTNDNACSGWINTGMDPSAALSNLAANTAHYWHARAINSAGTTYAEGSSTAYWTFTTAMLPPAAFVHSSPSNAATSQPTNPTLSWTASTGAASYEYCIDTSNNGVCNASWISTGTSTSVPVSGLANNTLHSWQVRATNAAGTTYANGSPDSFWNFTTIVAAPGAFSMASPANGSNNQPTNPTLDWDASAGATSYEYCIDTTNNNACNASWISTGTTSSVALSGLPNSTAHYWHVRAINAGGTTYAEGAPTAFRTFTTVVAAPAAFGHNSPGNGATGLATNPTLSWSASAGAASYEYCIDTTNNSACDSPWTSTGTNTSVALSSLASNTVHYWQVRAMNAGGTTYAEGAATAYWNFTTVVSAPGAFVHTSPGNGSSDQSANPTLTWSASNGATSYEYCIDTSNNGVCNTSWISTGTSTSVAVSLANSTLYSWQVRATNAGGTTYANGSPDSFWNFTTIIAAPGAFSHTSPSHGATNQPTNPILDWGSSAGATNYEYCIDTTNDSACSGWTSTGTTSSVALSGLATNAVHYWHVRATNIGGTTYAEGATTSFWSFTTVVAAPAAFGHNSPGNGATGVATNPTLSWSASSGATSYEYCIDTINNSACDAPWTSTGSSTSVGLSSLANNTPHYWQVRAINIGGTTYAEGAATSYWTFTTVVSAPAAFVHSSPANGSSSQPVNPTLSWSASSGAASYEYCIDTTNNGVCNTTWISTGTNTSVPVSDLAGNTLYTWQVRATNAGGTTYANGSPDSFWNFTTQVTAPGAFSHTSPANGAANQPTNPTLAWAPSSGATSYEYCIDTTNNNACNSSWISTGASTSVALSGLPNSTPHYWQVRANNTGGTTYAEGAATSFWSFTTAGAAPAAFGHASPANGATNQPIAPTLSWSASTGATSYEYCIDTSNNNTCNTSWISTGANTSVALSGLSNNQLHSWQVRAINASGTTYAEGAASSYWTFTTVVSAPGAFVHSSPSNASTNQSLNPTLDWSSSSGATSYEYCIDTTNNGLCNTSWISTGTTTEVTLSNLPANTLHSWQVRAINAGGTTYANGSPDSFWNFTTIVAAPGAFSHTSPADAVANQSTSPTLSWGASTGATSYEYCIDTTNNNACNGWTSTGTNTSVALSGLSNNTAHYWHVRANNAGGQTYAEGSSTAFWSFTTVVPAPGNFDLNSPTDGATGQPVSPTISWSASSGATAYEYCVDSTDDDACANWIGAGTNTSAGLSGLNAGTAYFWHVRAVNAGGTTYAGGPSASQTSFWSFVTQPSGNVPAFGQVDTPSQNASGLQGAIGVTGWALDDVGVNAIKIYRTCLAFEPGNCQTVLGNSVVYIGDAAFLEGARPDVAAAYPNYPNNTSAGWGYLLLTNLLPHVPNSLPFGGQGALSLYAVAIDAEGHQTLLGRSAVPGPGFAVPTAISMANDSIAKPFGSIDTPTQGEAVSGVLTNFGWALTPDSNTTSGDANDIVIPVNGSTVTVFIDGQPAANVAYNQCRGDVGNPVPAGIFCNDDVASIFGHAVPVAPLTTRTSNPTRYRNLDAASGAIGAFVLDTATLSNGMHSIAWSVTDSQGRTEGVGSRFFSVLNASPQGAAALQPALSQSLGKASSLDDSTPVTEGVWGRTGFDLATAWKTMRAKGDTYQVRLDELGRLELWLGEPVDAGYLVANGTLLPLPLGSSIAGSVFAWAPPAGFVGAYDLAFTRNGERINVTVTVGERQRPAESEISVRMHLNPVTQPAEAPWSSDNKRTVRIDGWAFDSKSGLGTGVSAVHVWATKVTESDAQATPVFLGEAVLAQHRPDVARAAADAPSQSGFALTTALQPGTYVFTAYAWNDRTERWEDQRSVTATIPRR